MNSKTGKVFFVAMLTLSVAIFFSMSTAFAKKKYGTSSGGWKSWHNDDDSSGHKGHGKSHDDDSSSGHKPKKKKPKREWLTKGNRHIDDEKHFLGTRDEADLVIKTNDTEKARVTTDGDVGIGTASPTGTLHVVGGTADADTDGKNVTIEAQDGGPTTGAGGNIVLTPGTDGDGLSAGSVYVGEIGTLDPPVLTLDVNGQIRIRGGAPFLGAVLTSDSFGNATWQSNNDADNDPTNELQTLSQAGNDVTLSLGGGTVTVADNDNDSSNELQTLSQVGNSVTLSNGGGTVSVDDGDSDSANEYNTGISFDGTSLTVTDAGGPQTVDISGLEDDADPDPNNELNTSVILNGTDLEVTDAGGTKSADLSGLKDNDWTEAGSNVYRLTGNIGIGTASPGAELHLAGSDNTPQLLIKPKVMVGGNISKISFEDPDGGTAPMAIQYKDDGAPDLSITGGNVGIGTVDPGAKLDVTGNIAVSGTVDSVDISDHAGNASAHHTRFTNSEETDPTVLPSVKDGIVWGEVGGIPADIADGDQVDDADADPTNERNTAANLTGTDLNITDSGGTLTVGLASLVDDADADPNNELNTSVALVGTSLQVTDAGGTISTDLSSLGTEVDPEVGSNTLNFMPKWNGSELVTGTVFDNGTKVGIGTTAPGAKLHIGGWIGGGLRSWMDNGVIAGDDSDGGYFGVKNEGGDRKDTVIAWGDNTQDSLRFIYNDSSGLPVDGAEAMRITAGGNVGIGTTTPQTQLSLGSNLANTKLALWDNGIGGSIGLGIDNGIFRFHLNQAGDAFRFYNAPAGTELMALLGTGNVGIGTASPGAKLDVAGNIRIADGTQGAGEVLTSDANGLATWEPIANDGDWTISGSNMSSGVSGNVGIGTASPNSKLDIAGNIALSGSGTTITTANTDLVLEQTGDAFGTTRLTMQNRLGSGGPILENASINLVDIGFKPSTGPQSNFRLERRPTFLVHAGNSNGEWQLIDDTLGTLVKTHAFGNSATIINSGNVGIGTTTPGFNLDVNGDINFTGSLFENGSPFVSSPWGQSGGNVFRSTGNVGIGTASPTAKLHVVAPGINLQDANRGRLSVLDGLGGSLAYSIRTAAGGGWAWQLVDGLDNPYFHVTYPSGNVGIGTASPAQKLDISGNLRLTGSIVAPEGTLRDDNGGWVRTYGATGWFSQTFGGGWHMSDSTWIRSFGGKSIYHDSGIMRTDGSLQVGPGGNRFLVNTSGNVGIGTVTPQSKLSLGIDLANTKLALWDNGVGALYGMGVSANTFRLHTNSATDSFRFYNAPAGTELMAIGGNGRVGIGATTPARRLHIIHNDPQIRIQDPFGAWDLWGGANFHIRQHDSTVSHFVIERNTGNVGIGVGASAPNFKLDVRGTIGNNTTLYHSDRRWKKNISNITSALDKVTELKGVNFDWKVDEFPEMEFTKGTNIGFIAQEVEGVLPELVVTGKDGFKSVKYANIVPILVEAFKELKVENDVVKNENEQLREKLALLSERQSAIEDMLLALSTDLPKDKLASLIGKEKK